MLATRTQVRNIVKKTAWSHLPNAKHIDRVLASVKANRGEWVAAGSAARDAVWYAARTAERDAAFDAAWGEAYHAAWAVVWEAAGSAARDAVWDAIMALIACDHAEKYLGMTPDELGVWYELSEDPACLLLLPYAYVQELVVT